MSYINNELCTKVRILKDIVSLISRIYIYNLCVFIYSACVSFRNL